MKAEGRRHKAEGARRSVFLLPVTFGLLPAIALACGCERAATDVQDQPPKPPAMTYSQRPTSMQGHDNSDPLAGFSSGPAFSIQWAGTRHGGVTPAEILRACEQRLSFEQSTELGSDAHARAIFAVAEAIDHLTGSKEVTGKPLGSEQ